MDAALSVREVAEFAGVTERAVNKAVEERIIGGAAGGKGRRKVALPLHAVPYAAVVGNLAISLPLEKKRALAHILKSRPVATMTREPIELAPSLTLDVSELVGADLAGRAAAYARSREEVIETNADVLGGTPVIRGTRISVYAVLGRVEHGEPLETILQDYPELSRETVETALTYARTHPLVGRPGGRPWTRTNRSASELPCPTSSHTDESIS